jgi:hypothetical protein
VKEYHDEYQRSLGKRPKSSKKEKPLNRTPEEREQRKRKERTGRKGRRSWKGEEAKG